MIISVILTIVTLVASWMIYKKMGKQGWEGIIPLYNMYVLCGELYGNGWKFLFLIVPLYNIYFAIKLYIDWAKAFNKGTGFAIGLLLLPFIFQLILAFDSTVQYGDGSKANMNADIVSQAVEKTKRAASSATTQKTPTHDDNALEKIAKLSELKEKGVISEEEFNEKKTELLKKV